MTPGSIPLAALCQSKFDAAGGAPPRRLIERGSRFVQVNWPAASDAEPVAGPDGSWDTHRNNFPMLRDWRCPVFLR